MINLLFFKGTKLLFGCALLIVPFAERVLASDETGEADATAAQIALWIEQLDDNQYLVREQATRKLLAAGRPALDALLQAAQGQRMESADRALWVLRRLGRSTDNELAIAALERLVQLRSRPLLVEWAEVELAERSVALCQQQLGPLGAEVTHREEQIALDGNTIMVATVVHVRLTDKWRGAADDLRCLVELRGQRFFRLEGSAVDDAAVALFERKEKLRFLQLLDTKVTPRAVDSLKERHPDAYVYMRNQALMGVSCANHPAGVLVQLVQPGTGAAAAGLVPGDVIVSIDGQLLPDFDRLTARIAQHNPGDKVEVEIVRGGERVKREVTLGRWPPQG